VHSSCLAHIEQCGTSCKFTAHVISGAFFYIEHTNNSIKTLKNPIDLMLFMILGGTILDASHDYKCNFEDLL
jgi:hypothetical protein